MRKSEEYAVWVVAVLVAVAFPPWGILGTVAIIGSLAWYDIYSANQREIKRLEEQRKKYGGSTFL